MSGTSQEAAFATGVPLEIYAFYRYSENSTSLSCPLVDQYQLPTPGCAGEFNNQLNQPPTRSLRPVIPNNARSLRITAAAGTKLAGAFSSGTVIPCAYYSQVFLPT